MAYKTIDLERRGTAVWLSLNRPDQLNALNRAMIAELAHALDAVEDYDAVSCLVVIGRGRAFCAGADLKFVEAMPADDRVAATASFLADASALMSRIEAFPKPVIAAVNGIATAGGLELLLCCDLVLAAEGARLGDGHANYGLLPGAGASVRLPRKIGANRAKYLFFTGDLFPAGDPILAGLVNLVVPAEDLEAAVTRLADKLAAKSSLGLRLMKRLADNAMEVTAQEGLARELSANGDYCGSHDRNEGLAAFTAGRKPVFRGR